MPTTVLTGEYDPYADDVDGADGMRQAIGGQPVAAVFQDYHGQMVNVVYSTSVEPMAVEQLGDFAAAYFDGMAAGEFSYYGCSTCGWAEEEGKVGGHDVLAELERRYQDYRRICGYTNPLYALLIVSTEPIDLTVWADLPGGDDGEEA